MQSKDLEKVLGVLFSSVCQLIVKEHIRSRAVNHPRHQHSVTWATWIPCVPDVGRTWANMLPFLVLSCSDLN